jgi:hypothetical protein
MMGDYMRGLKERDDLKSQLSAALARSARLERALKPFKAMADALERANGLGDDDHRFYSTASNPRVDLTHGHLCEARAALASEPEPSEAKFSYGQHVERFGPTVVWPGRICGRFVNPYEPNDVTQARYVVAHPVKRGYRFFIYGVGDLRASEPEPKDAGGAR